MPALCCTLVHGGQLNTVALPHAPFLGLVSRPSPKSDHRDLGKPEISLGPPVPTLNKVRVITTLTPTPPPPRPVFKYTHGITEVKEICRLWTCYRNVKRVLLSFRVGDFLSISHPYTQNSATSLHFHCCRRSPT